MVDAEKELSMNPMSFIESTSSLIEQLEKAFLELESHGPFSEDTITWNEMEEHFQNLDSIMKKKFEELEAKEKEFTERASQTRAMLAEKEASVSSKEQDMLDRIQELKDAAVAAITEARANAPEFLAPVSRFMNDENTLDESDENVGENDVNGEINPGPQLTQFCEHMDAKGLVKFIAENLKCGLSVIHKELCVAFGSATDPFQLVLDSLEEFFTPGETTQEMENDDTALEGVRRAFIVVMEALAEFMAKRAELAAANDLLNPETKQRAKVVADNWKLKLFGEANDPTNADLLEVEGFLWLLADFGIGLEFDENDLRKLVLAIAHQKQAPQLARSLGLTQKIPGIVTTLISKERAIEAVRFIQVFDLAGTFPPIPLLNTYLKNVRRKAQRKSRAQTDHNKIEQDGLLAVIECVKDCGLEAHFPLRNLQVRAAQLARAGGVRKEWAPPKKKRPRPRGGLGHQLPQPFPGEGPITS